ATRGRRFPWGRPGITNRTAIAPSALYTPLRPVQYPPGMMRTHSLRMSRHVLGPLPAPPAPATAARSRRAAPEQSLESLPVESPALTTCRAQPPRRYGVVLPAAPE